MFEQMMGGLEWELQCPKFIGESSLELAGLYTGFFSERGKAGVHSTPKLGGSGGMPAQENSVPLRLFLVASQIT